MVDEKTVKRETISITLDSDLRRDLDDMADKMHVTRSALVSMMLSGCLSGNPSELFGSMFQAVKEGNGKRKLTSEELAAGYC